MKKETGDRQLVMRWLSKEGVAVIPEDRMDATGEERVGETEVAKMTCASLAQAPRRMLIKQWLTFIEH